MRNLILVLAVAHLGASMAHAQRLSDRAAMVYNDRPQSAIRIQPVRQESEDSRTGSMVGGGLAGALVMTVVGGYLGYHTAGSCGDGMCELSGLLVGALAGEVVGVPIGVQMAGGGGSFPAQLFISAGVLAVSAMAVPVTAGLSLLAVVPVQLHLVVKNAKGDATRSESSR